MIHKFKHQIIDHELDLGDLSPQLPSIVIARGKAANCFMVITLIPLKTAPNALGLLDLPTCAATASSLSCREERRSVDTPRHHALLFGTKELTLAHISRGNVGYNDWD